MANWIINVVIVVVVAAWAAAFVAGVMNPDYHPPASVHMAMMAVVGALFGKQVVGKAYSDADKEADKKHDPRQPR